MNNEQKGAGAGAIDTPEFRAVEADFVKATIELSGKDHHADNAELFTARAALITHINDWNSASVAAARQKDAHVLQQVQAECWKRGARISELETTLVAVREQVLENAAKYLESHRGWAALECAKLIRALKSTPPSAPAGVEGMTESQINEGLKLHRLTWDKPSQLADGFRAGARWAERILTAVRGEAVAPVVQDGPFPERDPSKPAEQQGMFRKFDVRRTDGSDQPGGKHHGCRYFVLDLTHDAHAPAAMRAYAESCASTHPQLAADINAEFTPVAVANAPAAGLDKLHSAITEVIGCFEAAEVEGLSTVLVETVDERLKDLVERRLMHALYAAQGVSHTAAELVAATQAERQEQAAAEYTDAIGQAGERYHSQFKSAHPLPVKWRWRELWGAMQAAIQQSQQAGKDGAE